MNNFDFKIYHVDRFDHVLDESELKAVPFLSYTETVKPPFDQALKVAYFEKEQRLTDFLVDIITSKCAVSDLKLKVKKEQSFTEKEIKELTGWELEFLDRFTLNHQSKEIKIENLEQLISLIKLAFKEKIKVVVDFNNTLYSSGFDMCMFFQNIEEDYLKAFTQKHKLYVIADFYETLWTNEN